MCRTSLSASCTEACATSCRVRPCLDATCGFCPKPVDNVVPFPVMTGTETATFRGVEVAVTDPDAPGQTLTFDPDDDDRIAYDLGVYRYGTFEATFARLFQETFDLLVQRQRKYGPENISTQGIYGVFTRMASDKIERLRRSLNGKVTEGRIELDPFVDASDDTVEDALLDIANYALIMLALKRGLWGRPLEDPA